jgi:hypothetical protein
MLRARAYIFSVPRSVKDMESHLDGVRIPLLLESLMEAPLDVLWEITPARGHDTRNVFFDFIEICSEIMERESWKVLDIAVANETDTDFKVWVIFTDIINDLFQGVLRSLDPACH